MNTSTMSNEQVAFTLAVLNEKEQMIEKLNKEFEVLLESIKQAEVADRKDIKTVYINTLTPMLSKFGDFESVRFNIKRNLTQEVIDHNKKWGIHSYFCTYKSSEDTSINYYWHAGYLFSDGGGYVVVGKLTNRGPFKCSQDSWEQFKKGILTDELKNVLI